jgi:hypothetical protein
MQTAYTSPLSAERTADVHQAGVVHRRADLRLRAQDGADLVTQHGG